MAIPRVSASWARCPPESVPAFWRGSSPKVFDPLLGRRHVPGRVDPTPEVQMVGDRHGGIERRVLGDEADAAQLLGAFGRRVPEYLDAARAWL